MAMRVSSMAQAQNFKHILAAQEQHDSACSAWLQGFRRAASDEFSQLLPPNRRDERYRYVNLRDIFNTQYTSKPKRLSSTQVLNIAQQYQGHVYVFVDGMLATTANPLPAPLQFTSLNKLMTTDTTDPTPLLANTSADYFQQLNAVCFQDGAYIVVPAGVELDTPIYLVYVSNTDEQAVCYRNIIDVRERSKVRIVECYISHGEALSHLTNACTHLYLAPKARCSYVKLQSEGRHANHISRCEITQQQESALEMFALASGSKLTHTSTTITKAGEATECNFRYGYLGADRQVFDCNADVEHQHPKGKTTQLVRGIVKDQARGIFTGKINVLKAAQKTAARQQSKNILIGKECEVYMRPQLQIKADDVECSHGATSARISARDMLYLQSRGIPPATAMRLISDAHLGALLDGFAAKDLVAEHLHQANANFWRD